MLKEIAIVTTYLRACVHLRAQSYIVYTVVTSAYVLQRIRTGSKSNNFVFNVYISGHAGLIALLTA